MKTELLELSITEQVVLARFRALLVRVEKVRDDKGQWWGQVIVQSTTDNQLEVDPRTVAFAGKRLNQILGRTVLLRVPIDGPQEGQ